MERIECSVCIDERCQQNNFFIESVYVLDDNSFSSTVSDLQLTQCSHHSECFIGFPPSLFRTSKYNRQQLRDACKFMGVKVHDCSTITSTIFNKLSSIIISQKKVREGENFVSIPAVTITSSTFEKCAREALDSAEYRGEHHLEDFRIACDVVSKRRCVIVLLGGASGTGKSTLSSLLASRLGISSMLSTDSIRHILRNIIPQEQLPVLFCSTYEAGKHVDAQGLTEKQALIQGYLQQSDKVYEYLEKVIEHYHNCGESIVIEGVHLNVSVMKRLMKRFDSVIPFVVVIKDKKKHMERFAVRSKYMTLDPLLNKYIASYASIREIQKRFQTKGDETLIPKVDNSNLDRALGLCHATIVRCLRQVYKGVPIYDTSRKQTVLVHEEFNFVARNIWSTKLAQKLIRSKVSKGEIFKRFFDRKELPESTLEEEEEEEEIVNKPSGESVDSSSDAPEIGSIVSGSVDMDVLHPVPKPKEKKEKPGISVMSLRSESESELEHVDSMAGESDSSYQDEESDHSVHEEQTNEVRNEPPKQPQRKVSF